jgi:hypothetical protein
VWGGGGPLAPAPPPPPQWRLDEGHVNEDMSDRRTKEDKT